jgi:hypothetical protein
MSALLYVFMAKCLIKHRDNFTYNILKLNMSFMYVWSLSYQLLTNSNTPRTKLLGCPDIFFKRSKIPTRILSETQRQDGLPAFKDQFFFKKIMEGRLPWGWYQGAHGEEALVVAMVTDVRDDSVTFPSYPRSGCDALEGSVRDRGLIGSGRI